MGFIRTYFLAEVSAKLILEAKEVIYTDLAERREMYVRTLCECRLLRRQPVLADARERCRT